MKKLIATALVLVPLITSVSHAETVNIVCNYTHSLGDKPENNGPTSGTLTAVIDDQNSFITIYDFCPNATMEKFDQNIIQLKCSENSIKISFTFNRISGEVTKFSSYGPESYLIFFGQCHAAQKKF
jgi:hypothetical protein